ncbi:hypothetical protein [Pseudomonas sp. LRF_L74]|uniref:hypothetical protein n=1 Tax=Pseudomonas sp. LRF_L74 TaxID=3369422 RepID=UPI003F6390A7
MRTSLFLLLSLLLLNGCSLSDKPTAKEKALMVTSADIERQYSIKSQGRFSRLTNYFSRSIEFDYTANGKNFFLNSRVAAFRNTGEALFNTKAQASGALIGLKMSDHEFTRRALELQGEYGEGASLELLLSDDKPVGNLFHATLGRKSVFLVISGLYFEDADDFEDFIEPQITAVEAYDPPNPLTGWFGEQEEE